MGYEVENLLNNDDVEQLDKKGCMRVVQYKRDLSVMPWTAEMAYYASKMGCNKRQILCQLKDGNGVVISAGKMQWMLGNVEAKTDVKGVGDFLHKGLKGAVTGESAIKPKYTGNGILMLEPTYKHLLLIDLDDWGGAVTLDDGMFLAAEDTLNITTQRRQNISSAVFGGMGIWNTMVTGHGILAVECDCPKEELIKINLQNDTVKVDGNFVVAWSSSLRFTTERSTKTLIGSATSGEGLVNVYRGTGSLWMMPVANTALDSVSSILANRHN